MLDINLIRENPEIVRKSLRDRQSDPAPVDRILDLDARRRTVIAEVEALKAERNAVSKEISQIKEPAARQAKTTTQRAAIPTSAPPVTSSGECIPRYSRDIATQTGMSTATDQAMIRKDVFLILEVSSSTRPP